MARLGGDGLRVNIWSENWILLLTHPAVQSAALDCFEEATVNLSISADGKSWNENLLDLLFSSKEQQLTQKIQLPWQPSCDTLSWRFEKSGEFSVRTCYYELLQQANLSHFPTNYTHPSWGIIWQLNVPQKSTIFYGK